MLRIAEQCARGWRARALVTGEVIGPGGVAMLENMTVIADATTMEVWRPLVGMDKDEIVAQAERLETYPMLEYVVAEGEHHARPGYQL